MPTDEEKAYRRALKRIDDALGKSDKSTSLFEIRRIHRSELTPAVEALLAAKLAVLRESKIEQEAPKKITRLSDRYFK
jgi:hypothetical protein